LEKTYLDEFKIAEEFLQVSKNSLDLSLRTSANRLYFAFEKAVISYLLFNQKKVPKNHYNHLRNLYDLRMQADYGNVSLFVEFNKKIVEKNIFLSEKLIKKIKERLG